MKTTLYVGALLALAFTAPAAPQGRLYIKQNGKVAAALDGAGNLFSMGPGWYDASASYGGLQFKKLGVVQFVVQQSSASDPGQLGTVRINGGYYFEHFSTIPYQASGSLVFRQYGAARMEIDHVYGDIALHGDFGERSAYRKNAANLRPSEKTNYVDALQWADNNFYPGNYGVDVPVGSGASGMGAVSYWDKNTQIHQNGGMMDEVHGGPLFIPWHREFVNRQEDLLRTYDPLVSIPYWDWATDPKGEYAGDPRAILSSSRLGTTGFLGADFNRVGYPFQSFDNNGVGSGSYEDTQNPADPPTTLDRYVREEPPMIAKPEMKPDAEILANPTWETFREALERNAHDHAHMYLGEGNGRPDGEIVSDRSPADPMFWFIHSNCDRLWADWQNADPARKNPGTAFGGEAGGVLSGNVEPWSGSKWIRPWAYPDNYQAVKLYTDPSILNPRLFY